MPYTLRDLAQIGVDVEIRRLQTYKRKLVALHRSPHALGAFRDGQPMPSELHRWLSAEMFRVDDALDALAEWADKVHSDSAATR